MAKKVRMKSYDSFDLWKKDQTKSNQALIQSLRKMINELGLPLEESVKWSNGVWVKDNLPIIYLYAFEGGVQFGLFAGAMITDPKKKLIGNGKCIKHIPVHKKSDIDPKYFASLIKKAIKIKYR